MSKSVIILLALSLFLSLSPAGLNNLTHGQTEDEVSSDLWSEFEEPSNRGDGGGSSRSSNAGGIGLVSLPNPLKVDSIEGLFQAILDIMLALSVPIIVFFIIYSGFQYVVAQGNEDKLKKANQMLLWSIIGGLIILGARVIFEVISGTIKGFGV